MEKIYKELLKHIENLEVIDTHEHLPCFEKDRDKNTDVIREYIFHYFNRDLVTAGLPENDYLKILGCNLSLMEEWNLVEPYWEVARYTGYGRALDISAKELYGIKKISRDTIEDLNDKFLSSFSREHFKLVLKDKSKIKTSLLNVNVLEEEYSIEKNERSIICDKNFFNSVYVISDLVYPRDWEHIIKIEKESGIRICSFDNYLEAVDILIDKAYKLGAVALKNQLAYLRTLSFERVKRSTAEEEFNEIFKNKHFPDFFNRPICIGKNFQDYVMHYILDIANKGNLILQIHTGLQEGNGNIISNSNPVLLSNLFLEYPDVSFDLFHIGYPYQNEITVLAKNFANVYIDMCWAHIVSPNASVNALLEWIDTIPLNKISAFGGDYCFIDAVYGHLSLARMDVAKTLGIKVSEGLFDIEKAKEISGMLFYNNPLKIFKLEGKI